MAEIKVITNNQYRPIYNFYELSNKMQSIVSNNYDYTDYTALSYFIYKGDVYSLDEFMRVGKNSPFPNWNGYKSDSFFSGLVIKISKCGEGVIVGYYY